MGVSRLFALLALIISSLTIAVPAFAASWDEVEFDGSGWGHGVGLSQHGARAMATDGRSYDQILFHYFRGTSMEAVPVDSTIWVNLERSFAQTTLQVLHTDTSGGSSVSINSAVGSAAVAPGGTISISQAGSGCMVEATSPGSAPVTLTAPTDCSFDFSWYGWSTPGATPKTKLELVGCTLPDWNTPGGTVWRPCQYARGMIHLRAGAGGLHLTAEMLIDDYVRGISEVPFTWPAEALKAQAVAARSYAEGRRLSRLDLRPDFCWCHVVDTTGDQRYVGWGHHGVQPWLDATDATARQVLTHPDSQLGSMKVVTTYYSSSTGGATEYGHIKGFASKPVEWLSSVEDGWALDSGNPNASWTVTVAESAVAAALDFDFLTSARVTERRPGSDSAAKVEFVGMRDGAPVTVVVDSGWVRSRFGLKSDYFDLSFRLPGDELFMYKSNGTFRYEDLNPDASLGVPILSGTGYTQNWGAIASVDLDGDGQDEIFFYRDDGVFRYYDIRPDAVIVAPILAGEGYTTGWDAVTAVDLDGDGQDEMFFYRDDGVFRYYDIKPNGDVGRPILAGHGYTTGWDAITAVDLDGDGQDEMFFYRDDGVFRYYDIKPNGEVGKPILAGEGYTTGWDAITAVDLDGDGQDEMFFYRDDGLFRYYDVKPNGLVGSPIRAGDDYAANWSVINAIDLDGF